MNKLSQNNSFLNDSILMANNNLLFAIKSYNIFKRDDVKSIKLLKNQGLNNLVYILETTLGKYIVKRHEKSLYSDINKNSEYKIQDLASIKSLCFAPIFFDKQSSLLIYRFMNGHHKTSLNSINLKHLATSLKKLHSIKYNGDKFHIKGYFKSHNISKKLKNALKELKNYKKDFVLCHNDLNPKNILFTNNIKFIDWEYGSLNDRYFDLAAICIEYNLCAKKERLFINLYFKNQKADLKKLHTFKIIYKNVCYTWLKNRG